MKRIIQISFTIALVIILVSCKKNAKQQLQEYVTTYNSTAASFKAEDVTLTTARGYINDDKIELRFETNLEQNETNKVKANTSFPKLLKEMINKNQIPKELVEEGIQFDAYFLADDNTVLVKQIINKESLPELLQ
jgi:Tfp pilus assembly protein PilP